MSEETDRINKVLQANADKDFVQRIEFIKGKEPDDPSIPSIDLGKGWTGTHLMAAEVDDNGDWHSFPTIVRIDGELKKLNVEEAFHHAKATNEIISFGKNKDDALWFSKNYKKVWEKEE